MRYAKEKKKKTMSHSILYFCRFISSLFLLLERLDDMVRDSGDRPTFSHKTTDFKAGTSATFRDKTCGIELLAYIDPMWVHHQLTKKLWSNSVDLCHTSGIGYVMRRGERPGVVWHKRALFWPPKRTGKQTDKAAFFCKDRGAKFWVVPKSTASIRLKSIATACHRNISSSSNSIREPLHLAPQILPATGLEECVRYLTMRFLGKTQSIEE